MRRHRTTARGILLPVLFAGLLVGTASAAPKLPRIIFPVVGPVTYTDNYGDARGQGAHQGVDIMAPRKAAAVAAEAGRVKFHTTSARAGCMLYLNGASGTTYLYVHLNNDLTARNDNRGKCVAGVAYANGLKDGARVGAGQQIGYVGDSGDADGINPHLHFEVHPGGGGAVNPYPFLNRATRLLFAAQRGSTFTLALTGTAVSTASGMLELKVDSLRAWPGGFRFPKVGRTLTVAVPQAATVERTGVTNLASVLSLSAVKKGQKLTVWTAPARCTLDAQMGKDGALTAARVVLVPKS